MKQNERVITLDTHNVNITISKYQRLQLSIVDVEFRMLGVSLTATNIP